MEEFKKHVEKKLSRLNSLMTFFNDDAVNIQFDRLDKEDSVSQELLYLSGKTSENFEAFVFGFDFFVKDLEEQEFKRDIGFEHLNFKILRAFKDLKDKQKEIKVSDILHYLQDEKKDSTKVNMYVEKILSLAYYQNWDIQKDSSDIEGDYFIDIPDKFLIKPRQRFNYDISTSVYEDPNLFIFLNSKDKLNIVFKQKDKFSKQDIEKFVLPSLEEIFRSPFKV